MDFSFTPAQEELISKATALATTALAPRAAAYDAAHTYPLESWADLWKHGVLGIAIPRAYGGLGLDMVSYVAVLEALAKGCTNTTMTLHMHSVVAIAREVSEAGDLSIGAVSPAPPCHTPSTAR